MMRRPIIKATPKLTSEGKQVLQILMTDYQMPKEAAIKLMAEGGQMLAIAILTRQKI